MIQNSLIDYRTPAFDLDSLYGRGPDDQPYMYDDRHFFLLGRRIHGATDRDAHDLPRNGVTKRRARAIISDPRNDDNVMVSQLHGLLLKFHNRTLKDNSKLSFEDVQQLVQFHYQYAVLNDFLPRIVNSAVLRQLTVSGRCEKKMLKFFHWKIDPFMPVEFSAAAYRIGHSMVRPGYRLNNAIRLPIFPTGRHHEGLAGFRAMHPAWAIDWGRFIDIDIRKYDGSKADKAQRLQFAYRIDTSLVNPLAHLPRPVVTHSPFALAVRSLERGWRLGLPSGQDVARAMSVVPIADKDILIGKAVRGRSAPSILTVSRIFRDNCPLWVYILAEAMHHEEVVRIPVKEDISIKTPRLGPVGGQNLQRFLLA